MMAIVSPRYAGYFFRTERGEATRARIVGPFIQAWRMRPAHESYLLCGCTAP